MPIQREKDARRLAAFLRGHGPRIAGALAPRMTKVLGDGEQLPDVARLLDVRGRMVKAESDGLDQADRERDGAGREEGWLRHQLNTQAASSLRERVVG